MAKITNLYGIQGLDLIVFQDKNGKLAIRRNGLDGKRVKTDPAFKRTRQLGTEFAGQVKQQSLCEWLFYNRPKLLEVPTLFAG
jgi:hypothetical protein